MKSKMAAAPLARVLTSAGTAGVVLLLSPILAAGSGSATWTLQVMVNPVTFTGVDSVSCEGTVCIAAGSYADPTTGDALTLAENWNGASWAIQTTPNPGGSLEDAFTAVSCTWAKACTAVGWAHSVAGVSSPLAERWDGSSWAIQAAPMPPSATAAVFDGISCPRSTTGWDCEAVGLYYDSTNTAGLLAERWDGVSWTVQAMPIPAGGINIDMAGLSCSSPTGCTAVGSYQTSSSGPDMTLIERWNGKSWRIQKGPTTTSSTFLGAVSCPTATSCTAVGGDSHSIGHPAGGPISETWNGISWAIKYTPVLGTDSFRAGRFDGVACMSATSCEAVGVVGYGFVLEQWNGTGWQLQSAPQTPGAVDDLRGVACTAANACTAVGTYAPSPDDEYIHSFALRYS